MEDYSRLKITPMENNSISLKNITPGINILRNWTNKISTSSPTLRKLMAGGTAFTWSDTAKEEFKTLKQIAGNLDFLSSYDEGINTVRINTDAS